MTEFPQVLLLGNGINRAYQGGDWSDLLEEIHTSRKVDFDATKELPFPLQAVLVTEDHVDKAIKENQKLFYGIENIDNLKQPIQKLLCIPFDHILTTNYSYEIERVANPRVQLSGQYCKELMRHTDAVSRAEGKYLLHTYNKVIYEGTAHKVWHIHGEARKSSSVVLGHYYYGNLLGRYQSELQKRGNQQYFRQQHGQSAILNSWLDAFIMGDVYVLGFGFHFSEIDMWWLLNRKNRERARHGGLYFYEPSRGNEVKASLIEAYGGEFENMGFWCASPDYKDFYDTVIEDIKSKVNYAKGLATCG